MELLALEFPAILQRLAAATETPLGEELARALEPSGDAEEVARRQALTAEVIALFELSAEPPLAGIHDVREAAEHAARGGALPPRDAGARRGDDRRRPASARGRRSRRRSSRELASRSSRRWRRSPRRSTAASRRTAPTCATPRRPSCAGCARSCATDQQRAAEELRRLARSSALREHLQEDFVTQRGGRPVFAVKASARGSVPGIVHDVSASGQTLFVEPLEVVELEQPPSEAASAEREEVARILRELSASVGARADALDALVEATARSTSPSRAASSRAAGAAPR